MSYVNIPVLWDGSKISDRDQFTALLTHERTTQTLPFRREHLRVHLHMHRDIHLGVAPAEAKGRTNEI